MKVNDYSNLGLGNIKNMSVLELRKAYNSLDIDVDIYGEGIMKTAVIKGEGTEDEKKAKILLNELMFRARGDYYQFFRWITEPVKEEEEKVTPVATHPVPDNKPKCIHAYHSTHTFVFGGGFEIPYNINKGEAYNDDGTILAYIDPSGYKNKSHIVPPLRSMTKAALKAKLIANGNHEAALHL